MSITTSILTNSFDNFVVGENNRHSFNVCVKVATEFNPKFNPLIIDGDAGLGKTPLLRSIMNTISGLNPEARIVSTTGEDFASDFIESCHSPSKSSMA